MVVDSSDVTVMAALVKAKRILETAGCTVEWKHIGSDDIHLVLSKDGRRARMYFSPPNTLRLCDEEEVG